MSPGMAQLTKTRITPADAFDWSFLSDRVMGGVPATGLVRMLLWCGAAAMIILALARPRRLPLLAAALAVQTEKAEALDSGMSDLRERQERIDAENRRLEKELALAEQAGRDVPLLKEEIEKQQARSQALQDELRQTAAAQLGHDLPPLYHISDIHDHTLHATAYFRRNNKLGQGFQLTAEGSLPGDRPVLNPSHLDRHRPQRPAVFGRVTL